jgi:hypothetical protein
MKKKDFEKWALTQPNFNLHNGELMWFGFSFWGLVPECQKAPILEFKSLQT